MKILLATLAACVLIGCGSHPDKTTLNDSAITAPSAPLALIPYPESVARIPGSLMLDNVVHIEISDGAETSAIALKRLLKQLNITRDSTASSQIQLYLVDEPALGDEGYRLDIDQQIQLSANTDTGLFYAVQTLSQLLPSQVQANYQLPKLSISDTPAYSWRGNMLDVARSFLSVDYLKAHMDRMARFKLNRLHLHLSDDQGWRVQIQGYPKLTEIGGASAVTGGRHGFYTQANIRDLVRYGQARHITLVPEIDLPGHTQAAIASYHELACDGVSNLAPYHGLEVGFSKLCLSDPDTIYPFVTDVLTQIVALFPSRYIHIGGDEIKDPLYPEFIARTSQIVEDLGRTAIVWEEGSVADNDPDVLLQLWNDQYDIQPALERGHQLILSPCSYSYFDHGNYPGQPNTYDWCRQEGVSLERAYQLNPQAWQQVVGVESAMWSELVHSDSDADNRLWPRLSVTAELGWSRANTRNYQEFLQRLNTLRPMLDALGIEYYREPQLNW